MSQRIKSIYVLKSADQSGAVTRPKVFLERTASGAIVCGVHVSARNITQAREKAQHEFSKLLDFARLTATREAVRDETALVLRRQQKEAK